jgi:hypothetical protein
MLPEEEFDEAMSAHNTKPARARYGTSATRVSLRLATADLKAYKTLEDAAKGFAGVTGTATIKRAIRFYSAHLLSIKDDEGAMAQEVIELRRGTYAA